MTLAPYNHELNGSGTACADDCPACRWSSDKEIDRRIWADQLKGDWDVARPEKGQSLAETCIVLALTLLIAVGGAGFTGRHVRQLLIETAHTTHVWH